MVKKIKKYLKFAVCCAVIMSLVAPSYAALSASDGSAFVTKAEFDAALADFNSRLTTFEAGINSKIDSQVTSYLDRNGIWNGKAQTLESAFVTGKIHTIEVYNCTSTGSVAYLKSKVSSSDLGASSASAPAGSKFIATGKVRRFDDLVVRKIEKSGLCVFDASYLFESWYTPDYADDVSKSYIAYYNTLAPAQQIASELAKQNYLDGNYACFGAVYATAPGAAGVNWYAAGFDIGVGETGLDSIKETLEVKNSYVNMGGATTATGPADALVIHNRAKFLKTFFVSSGDKLWVSFWQNGASRTAGYAFYQTDTANKYQILFRVDGCLVY